MPRLVSIVLLAIFAGNASVPALIANPDSGLPACCRRDGKHHCAMMEAIEKDTTSRYRPARSRCAEYPKMTGGPIAGPPGAAASSAVAGPAPCRLVRDTQPRALQCLSHSRSRQKRGPPDPS